MHFSRLTAMFVVISELLTRNRAANEKCCPTGYVRQMSLDEDFERCIKQSTEPVRYHNITTACKHEKAIHIEPKEEATRFELKNLMKVTYGQSKVWLGAEKHVGRWYWASGQRVQADHYCIPKEGTNIVDYACCMMLENGIWTAIDCNTTIHALCTINLDDDGVECGNWSSLKPEIDTHGHKSNVAMIVASISLVFVVILVIAIIVYILRHSDDAVDQKTKAVSATATRGSEVSSAISDTDTSGTDTPSYAGN